MIRTTGINRIHTVEQNHSVSIILLLYFTGRTVESTIYGLQEHEKKSHVLL